MAWSVLMCGANPDIIVQEGSEELHSLTNVIEKKWKVLEAIPTESEDHWLAWKFVNYDSSSGHTEEFQVCLLGSS